MQWQLHGLIETFEIQLCKATLTVAERGDELETALSQAKFATILALFLDIKLEVEMFCAIEE